jgi:hypothetical protein
MIVVRVELWSARTGERKELARMRISNNATGTVRRRNYCGETFVGRSARALDRETVQRRGTVTDFTSLDLHIWNLVAAMLASMGYDKGRA